MVKININKINRQIVAQDFKRKKLIKRGDTKSFLKTYKPDKKIRNLNTSSLWDSIFEGDGGLSKQGPMTRDKIRIIANSIPSKKLSILDLGIGQGYLEELLTKRPIKYKFYGIDISPYAISRAKKMFKGKFILDDVLTVNKYFNHEKFDVVVAIELLEHISPGNVFSLYNKIFSILNPSGIFILSIPINEGLEFMNENPNAHIRDYSQELITHELELNGFIINKIHKIYAFEHYYFLKKLIKIFFPFLWNPNGLIIICNKK